MIIQILIRWIQNLIEIFRRIYYSMHGAIEIEGVLDQNKSKGNAYCFNVEHDNKTYQVQVISPQENLSTMGSKPVTLWWIPGNKGAMRSIYASDSKSRRALLTCDIVSAVSVLLLLAIFVMIYITVSSHKSGQSAPMSLMVATDIVFVVLIVVMIVASVIRRKLRK